VLAAVQAKVLRTLQYFPLPEGTQAQRQLHDTLVAIFNREWGIYTCAAEQLLCLQVGVTTQCCVAVA
jgi:hypothetical protein